MFTLKLTTNHVEGKENNWKNIHFLDVHHALFLLFFFRGNFYRCADEFKLEFRIN